jgi:predicted DCC family thiol-disulfide oxidoreductase YuxK
MPESLQPGDRVVLFDGVCNLCNKWVQFLLKWDRQGKLRLASVQSRAGQQILAWSGLPLDEFDTMVYVERGTAYIKSEAFLRVVRNLPCPWPLLSLGVAIPRPVRDWMYDRVALNRYALFGRSDSCMMPTPEAAAHFLK